MCNPYDHNPFANHDNDRVNLRESKSEYAANRALAESAKQRKRNAANELITEMATGLNPRSWK